MKITFLIASLIVLSSSAFAQNDKLIFGKYSSESACSKVRVFQSDSYITIGAKKDCELVRTNKSYNGQNLFIFSPHSILKNTFWSVSENTSSGTVLFLLQFNSDQEFKLVEIILDSRNELASENEDKISDYLKDTKRLSQWIKEGVTYLIDLNR